MAFDRAWSLQNVKEIRSAQLCSNKRLPQEYKLSLKGYIKCNKNVSCRAFWRIDQNEKASSKRDGKIVKIPDFGVNSSIFVEKISQFMGTVCIGALGIVVFLLHAHPAFAKNKAKFEDMDKSVLTKKVLEMKSSLKKGKKLEFDPDTTKAYGPLLDDYVKMYPDDIVGLKAQLNFKLHEGHYQEAVVILDRLIKTEPEYLEWRVLRGHTNEYLGNFQAAREDYEEILNVAPYSAQALQGMATVMQNSGESSLVLGMLEDVVEKAIAEGKTAEVRNVKLILAQVQALQGNLSDALTSYDKLIEEDEDDFRPYLCQGLVHSLMGDQERAAVSFSEFKKRCPKDYAENVGIDQMVVRAKLSSKRLQEEQKRREKAEKRGKKAKNLTQPSPFMEVEGVEEKGEEEEE